jgi:signal transduction histidine kinase
VSAASGARASAVNGPRTVGSGLSQVSIPALATGLLVLVLVALAITLYRGPAIPESARTVERAMLLSDAGEREVALPNVLETPDFAGSGGRVRYRIGFELERLPDEPLAVYIPKLSLAGKVRINGLLIGTCAIGPLERLRCLHQPQLFAVPEGAWVTGVNEIEVEVYASDRQANGLSAVTVGDAEALARGIYRYAFALRVEVIHPLTWLALCLGLISLSVALVLRGEAVHFWYGLTSIANALSNLNVLVQAPPVSVELFSWFVFSTRLVSIPLILLAFLAYFGRDTPARRRWLFGYALLAPVLVYLSGNDRMVVAALYLPLWPIGIPLLIGMLRWTRRELRVQDTLMTCALTMMMAAATHDYLRFALDVRFENVYLVAYASISTMLVMGALLVRQLVTALKDSRELTATLEQKVAEREAALVVRFERVRELEQSSARMEERERLLRDMHDGIGSQLASARVQLRSGELSARQAATVIQECIDDLRLLLDVSGNDGGSLEDALADFRFRLDRRLEPAGIAPRWRIALDGMPVLETDTLLQVMRIAQEAIANALRHADARLLSISAVWHEKRGELALGVRDDGRGIAVDPPPVPGRGLHNMRRRADAIGARLEVGDAFPGTAVRLTLPIAASPPQGISRRPG